MKYDKNKYKAWKLPHPLILHWIINPGIAFNEIVLGQRVPRLTLIDQTSSAPLMERQHVPCLNCGAMNDGRLWSKRNAFGHWFGYVCPECGGRIPCLWNITSIVLLIITFPIWIWIKIFAEKKWIKKEMKRLAAVNVSNLPEAKSTSWVKMGALFGTSMFCIMTLPKIFRNQVSAIEIAIQIVIWGVAGLAFGYFMRLFLGRKK